MKCPKCGGAVEIIAETDGRVLWHCVNPKCWHMWDYVPPLRSQRVKDAFAACRRAATMFCKFLRPVSDIPPERRAEYADKIFAAIKGMRTSMAKAQRGEADAD